MRTPQIHGLYLAIIAVLIVIVVYVSARAVRANTILVNLESRYGLSDSLRASLPRKGPGPLRQLAPAEILKPRTYDQYRQEVDALIARAQSLEEFGAKTRLSAACGQALVGGKRLRAVILLEVTRAASVRIQELAGEDATPPVPVDAGEAALFIEYLHAASLVIDDLPSFDGDLVRRGRPSVHAEAGPAIAQMAAFSLAAAALQNMCRQLDWIRDNCPEIKTVDRIGTRACALVAHTLGALGASGGQALELSPEDWPAGVAENMPEKIAILKTASLFELAVGMGWLVAGGAPLALDQMVLIGRHLGAAYQIADDLGDMAKDAARATAERPDANYANYYGRDIALVDMERQLRGAELLLHREGLWTPLWAEGVYPAFRAMCEPTLTPAPEPAPTPTPVLAPTTK